MTYKEQYLHSLSIKPPAPAGAMPHTFAGTFYELLPETADTFPTVLSGGTMEILSGYTLTCQPMDCRMLLYTRDGGGRIRMRSRSYTLEPGSLLYMDCSVSTYIIEPTHFPWRYSLFLVKGDLFSRLETLVPFETLLLHPLPPYSPVLRALNQLLIGSPGACLYNKLTDADLLHHIVTGLFMEAYKMESTDTRYPPFLAEIRNYLDASLAEPFRLDDLEERYHMSKYRICHEFSAAFGVPPLKYLNRKRLEAAANLLLTTDKKVHEISLEVGFENTNHFISLFKREMGTTPQAYRDAKRG